jgi:hypothetical protein
MRPLGHHGLKISRIEGFSFAERKTFDTNKKNPSSQQIDEDGGAGVVSYGSGTHYTTEHERCQPI